MPKYTNVAHLLDPLGQLPGPLMQLDLLVVGGGAIVEEAAARKKEKGDIKLIWLQEGIINEDARKTAEDNGFEFIQDYCMMKKYMNL